MGKGGNVSFQCTVGYALKQMDALGYELCLAIQSLTVLKCPYENEASCVQHFCPGSSVG